MPATSTPLAAPRPEQLANRYLHLVSRAAVRRAHRVRRRLIQHLSFPTIRQSISNPRGAQMPATTPKAKKRIVPRPSKGQSLKAAIEATNKQFAGTLAKLAK